MKKFLTIGRDDQCDIRINDDSDVTSRKHAMLEVGRNGKYFITDQSRNGTYVNGIRMTSGERIPITRKDSVSFAHVAELNWEQVPVDRTWLKIILVSLAVLLVAGGVGFSVWYFTGDKAEETVETISTEVASQPSGPETTVIAEDEAVKEEEPKVVEPPKEKKAPKPAKKAPKEKEPEPEVKPEIVNPIY